MIRGNRDFYITIKLNTGQKTNGVDDKCKKGLNRRQVKKGVWTMLRKPHIIVSCGKSHSQ